MPRSPSPDSPDAGQTGAVHPAHRQSGFSLRCDWGLDGALALAAGVDVAVVVDVLSFTTTVSVALDRGIEVVPHPWSDRADEVAARHGATLAVDAPSPARGRSASPPRPVRAVTPAPERLVLPSPNGSAIAAALAGAGVTVVAASLRNADAVAAWVLGSGARRVAVVAAGERWPGGALRPAVEDLWGAGAVLDPLRDALATVATAGPPVRSGAAPRPEAEVAAAAWLAVAPTCRAPGRLRERPRAGRRRGSPPTWRWPRRSGSAGRSRCCARTVRRGLTVVPRPRGPVQKTDQPVLVVKASSAASPAVELPDSPSAGLHTAIVARSGMTARMPPPTPLLQGSPTR